MAPPSSAHVTPEVATAYAAGALSEAELASVDEHIDECSNCRRLLSHAAQAALAAESDGDGVTRPAGERAAVPGFADGTRVNRYVIDGRLGEGGMGVVYAARDPELERRVALKVLRAGAIPLDHVAGELLRREAMAMARLTHPNVVGVYDIFEDAGTLFVAMELVPGATLREWLRAETRPWREVLRAFDQAGRGLGAAHAEGIVHRDFKPDNVLVGVSGRICVSDFGLSRMADAPAGAALPAQVGSSGERSLGGGTPRYMSPEQHRGERAGAQSDQFSFCVALYEGLYRRHPFLGPEGDARAGLEWKVRPAPQSPRVPAWVRRCVLKGLSPRPEARYPSMGALLDELGEDPLRGRVRALAAVGTIVAAAAGGGLWLHARHVRAEACAHADAHLVGVWDDAARATAAHAFDGTGTSFGHYTWNHVEGALGAYLGRWVDARTRACQAVLERGGPGDIGRDPVVACLDDRFAEVKGVVLELPSVSSASQLSRAALAVESLRPVDTCARTLHASAPRASSADDAAARAIRDDLATARALGYFGKFDRAATLAAKAAGAAQALGDEQLVGQALADEGYAHVRSFGGDWALAEAELRRAILAADRAGDDATRAAAWGTLVYLVGEVVGRPEEADRDFEQGMAALARLGGDDRIEMKLRDDFGGVLLEQDRAQAARDQFATAAARAQALGDTLTLGGALDNLGQADAALGEMERASEECDRAESILGERLGESHVTVLTVLNNSAFLRVERLDFEDAVARARRAVAGYEAGVGLERLDASIALETLGEGLMGLGRYEEAQQVIARSLAIRERVKASASRLVAPLATLGRAYVAQHQPEIAIPLLDRALAASAGDPEYVADARFALARALTEVGRDPARARALAAAAIDALDRIAKATPLQAAKRAEITAWRASHP